MKPANSIQLFLKRSAAAFLLLVLISITVTQSLHRHAAASFSDTTDNETLAAASDCSLCDYLVHLQSKQHLAEIAVFNFAPAPVIGEYTFSHSVYHYHNVHLCLVNKGPPTQLPKLHL